MAEERANVGKEVSLQKTIYHALHYNTFRKKNNEKQNCNGDKLPRTSKNTKKLKENLSVFGKKMSRKSIEQ